MVAVEPGGLSYQTMGRLPEPLAERLAAGQARRLVRRLPGRPGAVVAFDALQWPLARALLAGVRDCELHYVRGGPAEPARPDVREHYDEAAAAAAVTTVAAGDLPAALWPRLRALGVATGRED